MTVGYPPEPVYPLAIDSEYTLYVVYNTTEAVMTTDNQAWQQEIDITPVGPDEPEQWADNGFGNIDGELFYYDAVDKDIYGKIYRLRRLTRNLAGVAPHFVRAGSVIRSYVIAEHHNQLVQAIIQMEKFIGVNFSPNCPTLDYRIRHLQATPVIFDDFNCPDLTFQYDVVSESAASGTTIAYFITIVGNYTTFTLDFGDGTSTTSVTNGTHQYPAGASIDPVITIANDQCQIVQTPLISTNPLEPVAITPTPFEIPVPTIPPFPNIITPSLVPLIFPALPPINFPCLDLSPISPLSIVFIPPFPTIPSVIQITPAIPSMIMVSPPIPSMIEFGPNNLPKMIPITGPNPPIPSKISIIAPSITPVGWQKAPSITPVGWQKPPSITPVGWKPPPSVTPVGWQKPPSITPVGWQKPPSITPVGWNPPPSVSPVKWDAPPSITPVKWDAPPSITKVGWDTPPSLVVSWSTPPTLSCIITMQCPSSTPMSMVGMVGEQFQDSFDEPEDITFDPGDVGIPSEIKLIVPKIPDLKLIHNLPTQIDLRVPKINDIKVVAVDLPSEIRLTGTGLPNRIEVFNVGVPSVIRVESDIPSRIWVEATKDFPSSIVLDASGVPESIKVTGIPSSIELIGSIPSTIQMVMPENPVVDMRYNGAPIDVRIELDTKKFTGEDGSEQPCFYFVPCTKK